VEDNIQTIIIVIVSIFLLFIFPVYMAYEKKDDISYALAMRYTQDFVDEVRNKGYITKYMYEDYRAKLKITGNSYDIQMRHEYKRYDPITKYYDLSEADKKYILVKTTTQEEKQRWYKEIEQIGRENLALIEESTNQDVQDYITAYLKEEYKIDKVEDTYELSTQVYNEEHIVNALYSQRKLKLNSNEDTVRCGDDNSENNECQYAYTMNVDDTFNVIIKNTNITLATVMYNMVTANVMDENTRIYVNYGGTILSSKWYGDIDYAKLEPTVSLDNFKLIYSKDDERKFTSEIKPIDKINENYDGEYKIAFDIKPGAVTELKEKGIVNVLNTNYDNFNFALGNSKEKNMDSMMSVAVGYNGILLMTNNSEKLITETTAAINLGTYTVEVEKQRTVQETYTYTDDETGEIKTGVRDKTEYYTELEERQRKITDYSKAIITRESDTKVKVELTGKTGVPDTIKRITVSDPDNLLSALTTISINNPVANVYTESLGTISIRGTDITCNISFTATTISISASKTVSRERVILSYPMSIKDYTHMEIEVKKNDNNKYTAKVFVDGEKMEESVEMDVVPKIDYIGSTFIGTQQYGFIGTIKNIKLYN